MTSLQPKTPWIGIAASLVLHAVGFSPVWGATVSWINASGGVWSSPSNWDSGVPGASDDAVITLAGTYTVTLDVNASVASLTLGGASGTQTLSASSRTLTLGGASAVNANGALTLSSSTVGGTGSLTNGGTLTMTGSAMNTALDNEGNLIVRASSTVNGALTTGVGTALRVQGGNLGTGTLTVANGFTNNGTVELTSILGAQAATLVVSSGTLINEAGRAINALAGTGGSRTLTAQIDNRGTLSVGTSLTINKASADHLSSGTIDVSGGNLTLTQTGTTPTFTNSGTLTIAAGRTVSANGGELIHTGTSPSGGGTLSLNSVTATLNSDLSNAGVALSVSSSTVNGPGTLIDAAGQTLDVWSSTVNAPLDNEGILNFQGNSTVNGTLTTGAGTTLRVQGSNFGTGTLTVANGFTNNGTVELTSIVGGQAATLAVASGTLINAAGRTINALAGTGGTRTLTAELDNRGTLTLGAPLTINKVSADHVNSGTIDVSGGDLTLTQSGTTPTFTSSGPLTIAAGRTVAVSGGGFIHNSGGAVSGGGTLSFNAVTATLNVDLSNGVVALNISSSTVNGPGTLIDAAGQTLTVWSSTVNAPLDNEGILNFQGNSTVNGTLTTGAGTTLRVQGSNFGTGTLTVANGFTNNGTVELTSIVGGQAATLAVASGTLINAAGRTINALAGTGGSRTLTAELDNRGTLTLGAPLTINKVSADHVNSGTIDVSGGDLTLTQSGTTPTFTSSGPLTIAAGRTVAVSGGGFIHNSGGAVSGGGTLSFNAVTATLNVDLSNGVVALNISSSTVNGPGTLIDAAGQTLDVWSSTVNAPLDNEGILNFQGNSTVNGTLTTGAGTTLRVQGSNFGTGTLTVANGFTNNGTVELTSIAGSQIANLAVTTGTLINAAGRTINALAGTGGSRTLTAELDNRGTLTLGAPLTINKVSADHVNSGTIDVSGGDLTLTQSGTTPTFTSSGPLTIAAGRTVAVSGGGFIHNSGGAVSGGGTLSFNAVTATLNVDLSNGVVALNISSSTVNGPGTLIDAAGQTLNIWSSTVNAPLDNEGILNFQGNSTVNGTLTTGAGTTLRVQGSNFGTGTLTVANGFTNNGTVELTSIAGSQIANLAVTTGTLINAAGRTISALAGTGGTRNLTAELDNRGTLSVNSPLTLSKASADHLNSGTIDVSGGNLTLTQTGTTPTFTSSGTLTIAAVRTMSVTGGTVTNSATGLIRGGGTLDVGGTTFTNAGTISPGVSPAILSVTGNCPFSPTAALEIEIGGHVVGTDYDRLAVSGTASLDGALNVSFLPGFCAAAGDSFRVLTAATRSGTFAGGVHVSGKGNAVLAPHYDATGLTLLTLSNFFTLTASAGSGGTISPSGSVTVNCGGSQAFTITADPCHLITDVVVDGASVGPVSTYDFTNVTADHTISATFARIVYTINASAGPGGSIVPSGAVAVGCDASQGFTITPGGGFQISGVVVDGDSVGAVTAFTFPNVHANHTIAASFADVQPPSVQVIAPNGGETWDATSTRTVRWTATDNASVDSVNVDYSLHGTGGPWLSIQHGVAAVDSVDWTVPDVGTDSALVRVTAFDPASNSAEDLSDAAFRIRGPTGVPIVGQATLSLALAPNPTRGGPVHLRVSLPEAGEAAIEVLAVTGQRVWKSRVLGSSPGQRVVDWSGRDSRGRWVGPGVYIVRLRSPWGEKTTRLILLR